jgi:hypothetical protein
MQQNKPNPYAPPRANVSDVQTSGDEAPALWNPNAAANWSLLFSPVFGALVQMKNWQALDEPERASTSRAWAIGALVLVLLSAAYSFTSTGADITRPSGLLILIVWYFANGKQQSKYVSERFGKGYPRRGWGTPILVGILGFAGLVFLGFIIGFVIAMKHQ